MTFEELSALTHKDEVTHIESGTVCRIAKGKNGKLFAADIRRNTVNGTYYVARYMEIENANEWEIRRVQ